MHSAFSSPPSSRAATARFALAGVVLVAAQFALAYTLRRLNSFNDDLEHMAYGRFFSTLYERQFDVHMPLGALLAFLWGHVFGFTIEVHRMLAATLNAGILITLLHLGRRYLSLAAGFVGAAAYLMLQVLLWAYMHLSEVPSVLFALIGIALVLRLESAPELQGARRARRALAVGLLFGLAIMARLMAVEIFGLIVLIILVRRAVVRERSAPWVKRLAGDALWVTLGLVVPLLAFLGIFAALGTADDFIYWTLLHNMHAKAGVNPQAWVGDLGHPDIQNLWRFAGCALVASLVGYAVYWRRQPSLVRSSLWMVWAGAIGGWLGCNPSGIGQLAFHALPAFPFLGLAGGAGLVGVVQWARAGQRFVRFIAWPMAALVALGLGATLRRPADITWTLARAAPVTSDFAWAEEVGSYIREHSLPEDTLFVLGTNPLLYVTSERNSATTFSIVFSDVARYEDQMMEQLRAAPPRFVVLNPRDFWFSHNVHALPRVRDYLLENYRVTTAYPELLEPRTPENEQRVFRHPELPAPVAETKP